MAQVNKCPVLVEAICTLSIFFKIRLLRCLHKHPVYHFFGFASKRACFWQSFDVFNSVSPSKTTTEPIANQKRV